MTRFAPLTATLATTLGLLAALALPFPASIAHASDRTSARDVDTWISQQQADLTAALNGKLAVIPDLQVRSPTSTAQTLIVPAVIYVSTVEVERLSMAPEA